jgi:hypothetical protein
MIPSLVFDRVVELRAGNLPVSNPCVLARRHEVVVSLRVHGPGVLSSIAIGRLSPDGDRLQRVRLVHSAIDTGRLGAEDARLFELPSGRLAAIATTGDPIPRHRLSMLLLDSADDVRDVWHLAPREKNWSPILGGSMRLLFSPEGPVLSLDLAARTISPRPSSLAFSEGLRGGTQIVPHGDGFVSVVHALATSRSGVPGYAHHVVRYDRDLRIRRVSPPFFIEHGLEYAAGLAHWRGGWILSYGANGATPPSAWLGWLPTSALDA